MYNMHHYFFDFLVACRDTIEQFLHVLLVRFNVIECTDSAHQTLDICDICDNADCRIYEQERKRVVPLYP